MAKRGHDVFVLTPKMSEEQRTIEELDKMTIVGVPPKLFFQLYEKPSASLYFRICNADLYHSEEPTTTSYYVQKKNPSAKHIITFQDPRTITDEVDTYYRFLPLWNNYLTRYLTLTRLRLGRRIIDKGIHNADNLTCQAKYIIPLVTAWYHLNQSPTFLPNPVVVPPVLAPKAEQPTVCFLARWDSVKRTEILFELAKKFPNIHFIVPGKSHFTERDRYLREQGKKVPNIEMPGFVTEEEKLVITQRSWIMINTSIRECLPMAFLEAAASKCAILSSNNPDNFASNFGYHAKNENYEEGLRFLLNNEIWREKGQKGYEYVKQTHELTSVINQHITVYQRLLGH